MYQFDQEVLGFSEYISIALVPGICTNEFVSNGRRVVANFL